MRKLETVLSAVKRTSPAIHCSPTNEIVKPLPRLSAASVYPCAQVTNDATSFLAPALTLGDFSDFSSENLAKLHAGPDTHRTVPRMQPGLHAYVVLL